MASQKRLEKSFQEHKRFTITAELTGGPNYNFSPIEKFLSAHRQHNEEIPKEFDFAGIMLPQNPGGVANIDPSDVMAAVQQAGCVTDLEFVPHISCKDSNTDALTSALVGYRRRGIQTVLALTGDKPVSARGVFEVESVGLLSLIKRMNQDTVLKAKPGGWEGLHQFYAGAAVSPFKYTEASLMQQYYKMEKKVAAGAQFLVTQVGWDWKKSLELMRYLRETGITAPVIGNVYWLTTQTPAPRLMHDIQLPGCFVSDGLLARLQSESIDRHIDRAAQQIAMYRAIGAAGADVGGVHDYAAFIEILRRAAEIGTDWEKHKDNLCWPAEKTFYLYENNGKQVSLSTPKKETRVRFFDGMHRMMLNPEYRGFHLFAKTLKLVGAHRENTFCYKAFNALEKGLKYMLFECEECGDCYLPENFGYCTIGKCEKGMDNAPCGDATVEGYCGNNLDRRCVGEYIYDSASAESGGREKLRKVIHKPRLLALEHTSSLVNYLFGKDHTMHAPLIQIAETIHAPIPKTGKVMKELQDMGADAYTQPSGPLAYVRALIESQANEGADYIAVNLDAFGEEDPAVAAEMMKDYVKLVRQWGRGVPVCIDSTHEDVLIAGMKEWYNTNQPVQPPLINSIKLITADKLMALKKEYDFAFVGLLVAGNEAWGPDSSRSVDELFGLARELYAKAVQYGFKPGEIFFDVTAFPIMIDRSMEPGIPGYTYLTFETVRKIKSDPTLKHCHCTLEAGNCCRDLPGRKIGICRAYMALAMEYGLDAGIVNTSHQYGLKDPDPELKKLIDACAAMDGAPDKLNEATTLMEQFCASTQKPT